MAEKKMAKMAVLKGPNHLDIESFPLPEVKDDGILNKIEATSICGSDAHSIRSTPAQPSPLGHEFTGKIGERGERANETIYYFSGSWKRSGRLLRKD